LCVQLTRDLFAIAKFLLLETNRNILGVRTHRRTDPHVAPKQYPPASINWGRIITIQELNYRKHIVRQLRMQYVDGVYGYPVILKLRLRVTEGHRKWYHSKAWVRFPIHIP